MASPVCPRCHRASRVDALLSRAGSYCLATGAGAASCPACRATIEFRVRPGVLELGYTCGRDLSRFEPTSSMKVPGLRVVESPDGVAILHEGVVFRVRAEGRSG